MSDNFGTWGEATSFCEKYGFDTIVNVKLYFEIAEALVRAHQDGKNEQEKG